MILNETIADIKKVLARVNIIWPALILAASRKDKVIGRTKVLRVSIITRKGFNHIGAPEGRRWAANDLGLNVAPERIIISQIGKPKEKENKIWEENLKE